MRTFAEDFLISHLHMWMFCVLFLTNAATHRANTNKIGGAWLQHSRSQWMFFYLRINPFSGHPDLRYKNNYWKYVVFTQLYFRALHFLSATYFWKLISKTCYNVRTCVNLVCSFLFLLDSWETIQTRNCSAQVRNQHSWQATWINTVWVFVGFGVSCLTVF